MECFVNFSWKFSCSRIDFTLFKPLNTKRQLFYLKAQFVPRSKHFPSRL